MYESNSNCEVHYGPSQIKNPATDFGSGSTGPHVGLVFASTKKNDNNKLLKVCYLYGDPANPKVNSVNANTTLSGMPKNGTTYTFTYQGTTGINSLLGSENSGFNIYPNPASGILNCTATRMIPGPLSVTLKDMTGKVVSTLFSGYSGENVNMNFDLSGIPTGIYLLTLQSPGGLETTKLMIR
jgi:hypothetical protein